MPSSKCKNSAATRKHIMVGQNILRGGGNERLRGKNKLNIIKNITIQETSWGQGCCQVELRPPSSP